MLIFQQTLLPTASFLCVGIYTPCGRVGEVAGAIVISLELRASLSYSSVHVLHLVSD